jgi:hypothetical protein
MIPYPGGLDEGHRPMRSSDLVTSPKADEELHALDTALARLVERDPDRALLVVLRYFAGPAGRRGGRLAPVGSPQSGHRWDFNHSLPASPPQTHGGDPSKNPSRAERSEATTFSEPLSERYERPPYAAAGRADRGERPSTGKCLVKLSRAATGGVFAFRA